MSLYNNVWKSTIIASIITFIISMFTEGKNSQNALIAVYSLLLISITLIVVQLITSPISKKDQFQKWWQLPLTILRQTGPFLIIVAIIGFMLYLIVKYKNQIIENHVPQSFYSFSNITMCLIFLQMYIIYNYITCINDNTCYDDTKYYDDSGKIGKVTVGALYLLGVLMMISTGIVYTILTYFKTDGFQVLKGIQQNAEKMQFNYLL